jgi:prepilin-type N-terminal cleavage/methylation domain-containing protein
MRSVRIHDQRGLGLVEILVASAILGVALSVMLGNLGTLVVGARVADRRTGEERVVRNRIEALMAQPEPPSPTCPSHPTTKETVVSGASYPTTYTIDVVTLCTSHYLEYTVTASDGSGRLSLKVGRYQP